MTDRSPRPLPGVFLAGVRRFLVGVWRFLVGVRLFGVGVGLSLGLLLVAPRVDAATRCGPAVCGDGQSCCNPTCGICAPPGGGCIALHCGWAPRTAGGYTFILPADAPSPFATTRVDTRVMANDRGGRAALSLRKALDPYHAVRVDVGDEGSFDDGLELPSVSLGATRNLASHATTAHLGALVDLGVFSGPPGAWHGLRSFASAHLAFVTGGGIWGAFGHIGGRIAGTDRRPWPAAAAMDVGIGVSTDLGLVGVPLGALIAWRSAHGGDLGGLPDGRVTGGLYLTVLPACLVGLEGELDDVLGQRLSWRAGLRIRWDGLRD